MTTPKHGGNTSEKKLYAKVHKSDLFESLEAVAESVAGSSSVLEYRVFELGQEYEVVASKPEIKIKSNSTPPVEKGEE